MQKITVDDPESRSADVVAQNLDQLKALFPEVFIEDKVDFHVLKQLLGAAVDEREEKYGLNWHGKRQARQLALTPSTGTLRPCLEDSVDWDTTQNLMIEGDNLEVLKLLQKSYAGRVKLIHIDPPYNTGKDFVYPDDYRDNIRNYLDLTGQIDGAKGKLSSNTEASGRFHTAWLNMLYPRLKLGRSLLSEVGSIFITIDDGEVANLMAVMNEIFGEENFVSTISWHKRVSPANDAKYFSSDCDTIVIYAKNKEIWHPQKLQRTPTQMKNYKNHDEDPRGPWNSVTYTCNKSLVERPNLYYPIINPHNGEETWPKETAVWKYSEEVTKQFVNDDRLYWGTDGEARFPRLKRFLSEMDGVVPRSLWVSGDAGSTQTATAELMDLFGGHQVFDTPKPTRLIRRILEVGASSEEDIVVDFFAGSGTTGHAVLAHNADLADTTTVQRFVLVQLPEPLNPNSNVQKSAADYCDRLRKPRNIAELTKERLRLAGSRVLKENPNFSGDLGFRVFKLDTSNIHAWEPDRDNLDETLLGSIEHIKPDRSEEDILYELLLKLGLDLCVSVESRTIAGKAIRSIGAGTLITCLDERIDRDDVEPLASGISDWHAELAPAGDSTVVFRDSAFVDDVAKTNLAAILEQRGLGTVRSL